MSRWTRQKLVDWAKREGFKADPGATVEPGDSYLAGRNTGTHLLTAKTVDVERGWVVAVEPAYSFDTHECVKVVG